MRLEALRKRVSGGSEFLVGSWLVFFCSPMFDAAILLQSRMIAGLACIDRDVH
jgi:hypothetical protein